MGREQMPTLSFPRSQILPQGCTTGRVRLDRIQAVDFFLVEQDQFRDSADSGTDLQDVFRPAHANEPRQVAKRERRGDTMGPGPPAEANVNVSGYEEVVSLGD